MLVCSQGAFDEIGATDALSDAAKAPALADGATLPVLTPPVVDPQPSTSSVHNSALPPVGGGASRQASGVSAHRGSVEGVAGSAVSVRGAAAEGGAGVSLGGGGTGSRVAVRGGAVGGSGAVRQAGSGASQQSGVLPSVVHCIYFAESFLANGTCFCGGAVLQSDDAISGHGAVQQSVVSIGDTGPAGLQRTSG